MSFPTTLFSQHTNGKKNPKKKNFKKKSKKKMAGGGSIYELRSWMYLHKDSDGRVTNAFLSGLETFMHQPGCTPITQESGKMFCPCRKCKNSKFARSETVWKHLVNK